MGAVLTIYYSFCDFTFARINSWAWHITCTSWLSFGQEWNMSCCLQLRYVFNSEFKVAQLVKSLTVE